MPEAEGARRSQAVAEGLGAPGQRTSVAQGPVGAVRAARLVKVALAAMAAWPLAATVALVEPQAAVQRGRVVPYLPRVAMAVTGPRLTQRTARAVVVVVLVARAAPLAATAGFTVAGEQAAAAATHSPQRVQVAPARMASSSSRMLLSRHCRRSQ